MKVTLNVNGKDYPIDVDPEMPLLWALRDLIGLTGTKYGCGIHLCGACTVLVDGQAEKSCDKKAAELQGQKIVTVEGLSDDNSHPLQRAWIAEQVPQCGYCQPGMLMKAAELLRAHPGAPDSDIDGDISNICVCGTYNRVRKAIHRAATGG